MTNDRHKIKPKAVRMPGGLLAWYQERAAATGEPVNALLVAALEEGRRRHDGGSTTPPVSVSPRPKVVTPRRAKTTSAPAGPVPFREPERADCPHPKARVIKGFCGACGQSVSR